MSRALVSCICLTTWPKRAAMLRESLRAYALQHYEHRRLFVINDGEPLRSLAADVTVTNVPKGLTLGEKRNVGLSLAGESWAATWDDDDFALPETLLYLMNTAYRGNYDYVHSNLYALANSDMKIGCIVRRWAMMSCVFWAPTARRVGGYPAINIAEDVSLHNRLTRAAAHGMNDRLTYVYRRHTKNITVGNPWGNRTDQRLADCIEDQRRWPEPKVQELQRYLDHCRSIQTPDLVEPTEGKRHVLPSHASGHSL